MVIHHMPSDNNSGLLSLRQHPLSTASSIPEISNSVLLNIAPLPQAIFHIIYKTILTFGPVDVNRFNGIIP
jgi:hypothetical protein